MKLLKYKHHIESKRTNASLTVETSLVLPLFLFLFISLLYFLQLITLKEVLQKALTESGLGMARAAYIYSDFQNASDAEEADDSIFEEGIKAGLQELSKAVINSVVLKQIVAGRLNADSINNSLIVGGLDGIRFDGSKVLWENNDIDIVIRYKVRIPVRVFGLREMNMIQRVKLRGWSGHQLPPLYTIVEENDSEESMVYVTENGRVYHLKRTCSHISLSIETIIGKPTWQRNKSGGKYYPCESCCTGNDSELGTYYITSYGDRYHIRKDCSGIKRTVKEIPLSEVGDKLPCKRCGG